MSSKSIQLTEVRREKIDFRKIAEESGARLGNLCHSPSFGWGVRTQDGYPADFCSITPPPFQGGESELRIEGREWVFFSALGNNQVSHQGRSPQVGSSES